MIRFECDYAEGAHPKVLEALVKTNFEQTPGYGVDGHCAIKDASAARAVTSMFMRPVPLKRQGIKSLVWMEKTENSLPIPSETI